MTSYFPNEKSIINVERIEDDMEKKFVIRHISKKFRHV